MNRIGIIIAVMFSLNIHAQKRILELFSLKDNPSIHTVKEKYKEESAVVIKDYRAVNINYRLQSISDYQVNTVHKIIHLNDDIGVENYNEISIPLRKTEELIRIEVRSISPDGRVNVFDDRNLKEVVKGDRTIKKLAVEGLEVGGELEFLYSVKSHIKAYGREYFGSLYPIEHLKFELFEKNVVHSAASYNGLVPVKAIDGNLICEDFDIEPITKETKSSFRSKIKYIDYKVEKYGENYDISTWNTISVNILEQFQSMSMRINTFLKDRNLKSLSEEEQVFKIEDYIKKTIVIERNADESYEDITLIQKNKLANKDGVVKLYLKCFQKLKIPVDLVLSTSRYDGNIDENYPHTMDMQFPILYFPNLKKYVNPYNKALRLGMPDAEYGKSRALQIKTKNSTALTFLDYDTCEFVTLPILEAKYNTSQKIFSIELDPENTIAHIDYMNKARGYIAARNRDYISKHMEGDIFSGTLISGIEDIIIDSIAFENLESYYSTKPGTALKVTSKLQITSIVENLEDEIFIHVGKLVGSQSKVYGEGDRAHDVVLEYPKINGRRIDIKIPDGYTCANLDDLNKHVYFMHDKTNAIYFNVKYKIEDGVLKITMQEGYNTILIKKDNYKDYQTVINAVADFNAFVLVLEKKE